VHRKNKKKNKQKKKKKKNKDRTSRLISSTLNWVKKGGGGLVISSFIKSKLLEGKKSGGFSKLTLVFASRKPKRTGTCSRGKDGGNRLNSGVGEGSKDTEKNTWKKRRKQQVNGWPHRQRRGWIGKV